MPINTKIRETRRGFNLKTHVLFIDYEKVSDKTIHSTLKVKSLCLSMHHVVKTC